MLVDSMHCGRKRVQKLAGLKISRIELRMSRVDSLSVRRLQIARTETYLMGFEIEIHLLMTLLLSMRLRKEP